VADRQGRSIDHGNMQTRTLGARANHGPIAAAETVIDRTAACKGFRLQEVPLSPCFMTENTPGPGGLPAAERPGTDLQASSLNKKAAYPSLDMRLSWEPPRSGRRLRRVQ